MAISSLRRPREEVELSCGDVIVGVTAPVSGTFLVPLLGL
jgi:hypothetical protein